MVTDALNMGAITEAYSISEAAIMAVNAGIDLLLMPADFVTASDAIINEVKNGNITEERINESVRRILRVKLTL